MTILILALCELFKTKQKTFKDINLFIMKSSQNKKQGTLCCSLGKHNHELLQIFVIGGGRMMTDTLMKASPYKFFNTKTESKLSHLA